MNEQKFNVNDMLHIEGDCNGPRYKLTKVGVSSIYALVDVKNSSLFSPPVIIPEGPHHRDGFTRQELAHLFGYGNKFVKV